MHVFSPTQYLMDISIFPYTILNTSPPFVIFMILSQQFDFTHETQIKLYLAIPTVYILSYFYLARTSHCIHH